MIYLLSMLYASTTHLDNISIPDVNANLLICLYDQKIIKSRKKKLRRSIVKSIQQFMNLKRITKTSFAIGR